MDKNEILEKSREENKYQDERDKQIELESYKTGLSTVIIVTGGLYLLLFFKSKLEGTPFGDWYLFLLPMWANMAGAGFVKWRHYKRKGDLINAVCGVIMILLVFQMRLFGPVFGG